jgi:hypothetical protein
MERETCRISLRDFQAFSARTSIATPFPRLLPDSLAGCGICRNLRQATSVFTITLWLLITTEPPPATLRPT